MKKSLAASLALLLVLAAGLFVYIITSEDPPYLLRETIFSWRYKRYDDLIRQASERYGVAPELIKAVIWRESQFRPEKVGSQGERGLMQITENAAADWARAEKIQTFVSTDLFDPKVNIEAGTWYLNRALTHWSAKDNPVPFALAEYKCRPHARAALGAGFWHGRHCRRRRSSGRDGLPDHEKLHRDDYRTL